MKYKYIITFLFTFILVSQLKANNQPLNLNNLLESSIKNEKQLMVFFHMNYCGYCKRMDNRTLKNSVIQKIVKKSFTFIDINIDEKETILFNKKLYTYKEFAEFYDIDFYPTIIFLDDEFEITYTSRGYRKIKKFQKILEYIETKSFEKIDFFDYYKKNKE